jgi:hypothetical protein
VRVDGDQEEVRLISTRRSKREKKSPDLESGLFFFWAQSEEVFETLERRYGATTD